MKKVIVALVLCLGLCGCSWMDGNYVSVTPYTQQNAPVQPGNTSVSNYPELEAALAELVESGSQSGVLSAAEFDPELLDGAMERAVRSVTQNNPVGAYAVEDITYQRGTSAGAMAVAVEITYRYGVEEIRRIKQPRDLEEAKELIYAELDQCGTGVVMKLDDYTPTDFVQIVESYANDHPESVMELPQVKEKIYPDSGNTRVVELRFAYQTSRESLKSMQSYVRPVFSSAWLYVVGDTQQSVKYSQLFSFLMERYDYQIETSITPSYSLLRHGVGDSRAFATVYAAMCRQSGLECLVISGTRGGEARFWNMICVDGVYYHVDLLQSSTADSLRMLLDADMQGYVWDYSAYPAAVILDTGEKQE